MEIKLNEKPDVQEHKLYKMKHSDNFDPQTGDIFEENY